MEPHLLSPEFVGITGIILGAFLIWLAVCTLFLPLFVWGIYRSNYRIREELEHQTQVLESIHYALRKANGDIEKFDL